MIAAFLNIGIMICDGITILAIINAFHANMPFNIILLTLLLSMAIGALPLSPGSLIAYETAMTYFLTVFGLPVHAALIVTLLYRFFTFWLPIPIGLILYRNLQKG